MTQLLIVGFDALDEIGVGVKQAGHQSTKLRRKLIVKRVDLYLYSSSFNIVFSIFTQLRLAHNIHYLNELSDSVTCIVDVFLEEVINVISDITSEVNHCKLCSATKLAFLVIGICLESIVKF